MAGKKGRSGRKKKTTNKKQPQRPQLVEILPPVELAPESIQPENEKPLSFVDKMKGKIAGLLESKVEEPQSHPPSESHTPSGSSASTAEFEVVAERLEEKYSGVGGEPAAASGPEAAPSISLGSGHFITPSTVEAWLVVIFGGLSKAYGKHWELGETDKTVLVPVYTSAIDEQAPRWFAESENKALWIAVIVTVLFVVSRSKNGGRLVEWGIDKVSSLVSKVGGTTKTA